jgi:hypothetical protein
MGIEAATGGSAVQQLARLVLSQVIADAGGQAIRSGLNSVSGATAPSEYSPANVAPDKSKYFIGIAPVLNRERWEVNENFRRKLLGLPPVASTSVVIDEAVARQEQQANSLSAREKSILETKGKIAQYLAQMNRQYDLSIENAQGNYRVENTKQQQIGEIEKERVRSQYGLAGDVLNSSIANIYSKDPYSDSSVLRQLATPV